MLLLCKVNFIKKYTYLTVRITLILVRLSFKLCWIFLHYDDIFVRCKYETLLTFVKNTANKIHCHAYSAKQKKCYHLWNNLKIFLMHEMKHNFIEPKNTWQFVRLWDWGFPTIKGTWCEIIHLLVNLPQSLQINSFTRGLDKYIGFKTIFKELF